MEKISPGQGHTAAPRAKALSIKNFLLKHDVGILKQ
jgi:hypothetical protein